MVSRVDKNELTSNLSRLYGRVCDAEYGDGDVLNLTAEVRDIIGAVHQLLDEAMIAERVNGDLRLAVSITNGMNAELKRQLRQVDSRFMGEYAKAHGQKERIAELETEVENLKSRASTAESYGAYVSGKLESTRRQRYDRIAELEAEVDRLKSDLTAATNSINNATEKFGLTGEGSFTDQLSAYFNEKIVSRYASFEIAAADSLRLAKDIAGYPAVGGPLREAECVPEFNKRAPMSYAFEPMRAQLFPKPTGILGGIVWDVFIMNGDLWARKVEISFVGKKEVRVRSIGSGKSYYVRKSNLYPWSSIAYPGEKDNEYQSREARDAESCLRLVKDVGKVRQEVSAGDVRYMLTNDHTAPQRVTVMQVKGVVSANGLAWYMAVVKDETGSTWAAPTRRLHSFVPSV